MNRRRQRKSGLGFALAALFCMSGGLQAQPVADLEIHVAVEPADLLTPPGSSGLVTITVTNHGPDLVRTTAVLSNTFPWSLVYGEPIIFRKNADSPPCSFSWGIPDPPPGGDLVVGYTAAFNNLSPGDDATCLVDFTVNPQVPDVSLLSSWRTVVISGNDPNPTNDEIGMTYRIRSPAIPTVEFRGLFLMACLFGGAALWTLRRN